MSKKKNQAYYDKLLKEIHLEYISDPKGQLRDLKNRVKLEAEKRARNLRNRNKKLRKKVKKHKIQLSLSIAEEHISKILINHKISFIREKEFIGCKNPITDQSLRFDFYIPSLQVCIEYDGKQHFEYVRELHGPNERVAELKIQAQQKRDKIKNEFCRLNSLKLVRFNSKDFYRLKERIKEELGITQTTSQGSL